MAPAAPDAGLSLVVRRAGRRVIGSPGCQGGTVGSVRTSPVKAAGATGGGAVTTSAPRADRGTMATAIARSHAGRGNGRGRCGDGMRARYHGRRALVSTLFAI